MTEAITHVTQCPRRDGYQLTPVQVIKWLAFIPADARIYSDGTELYAQWETR